MPDKLKPAPEEFHKGWRAYWSLWRKDWVAATVYTLILFAPAVVPSVGWLLSHKNASELQEQLTKAKQDLQVANTRLDNLQSVVAPIMRQAAKEFPGVEINESLRKIVQQNDFPQASLAQIAVTARLLVYSTKFEAMGTFVSPQYKAFFWNGSEAIAMVNGNSVRWYRDDAAEGTVFEFDGSDSGTGKMMGKPTSGLTNAQAFVLRFPNFSDWGEVEVIGSADVVINSKERVRLVFQRQIPANGQVVSTNLTPLLSRFR